jgi:hypothetical protein
LPFAGGFLSGIIGRVGLGKAGFGKAPSKAKSPKESGNIRVFFFLNNFLDNVQIFGNKLETSGDILSEKDSPLGRQGIQ